MSEIASSIGISKKTLYQHYADKEAIVSDTIELILQCNISNCEACKKNAKNAIHEGFLATQSVMQLLKNLNPVFLYDMKKYTPEAYKKFLQFKKQFLYTFIYTNIEWGISDGLFREDIDINLLVLLRIESIDLPFQKDFNDATKITPDKLQTEVFLLFLYGIATPKGVNLINHYKKQKLKTLFDDTK